MKAKAKLIYFVLVAAVAGCFGGDSSPQETSAEEKIEARVLERSGKTRSQHEDFAPFALFDRDGDGRLSADEARAARQAGLDVGSLDEFHLR